MYIGTTVESPNGTIQVSVLIDSTPQPLYRRPGDGKVFAAGIPGRAYTLRAVNLTRGRVEIVCAVDQRNTLQDEPADMRACGGMVVPAGGVWDNHGWRLNDSEVRVGRTSFTRVGNPDVLVIGYDTEDRLRAQGILGPREPEAFPGAGTGYEKYATGS